MIEWNRSKDRAYRRTHKADFIPMRAMSSPHLWELPLSSAALPRTLKVRYRDGSMRFSADIPVRTSE